MLFLRADFHGTDLRRVEESGDAVAAREACGQDADGLRAHEHTLGIGREFAYVWRIEALLEEWDPYNAAVIVS